MIFVSKAKELLWCLSKAKELLWCLSKGMLKTKFVHEYLNNQINVMFADDLLKCIKSIYHETSQKYNGDELFMAMLTKMHAGIERDFSKQAAGIAVLTYFFHICEIFEK